MSTKTKQAPADTKPKTPEYNAGEGFEERSSDIVGVWNPESMTVLRFVPSHAIVGDAKKFDKTKPSCLIFGKLTHPVLLQNRGEEDEPAETFMGKAGDLIGVWAKPGMKDLATLCGVEVHMFRNPEKDKDIGKGNDLKAFKVLSKETPNKLIPITIDRRDLSKGQRCILDAQDYGKKVESGSRPANPAF